MSYPIAWYPFAGHPDADSCWSLSAGPDGRIYVAACAEGAPGGIVKLVRYNRPADRLDYLLDLDEAVDDPRDSGRATQCKIHYSFAPSPSDGILYMATHLSGPPIDQPAYSPWNSWHDPERCFRGSALLAWDTQTDTVLWWDTLIPKEGCRCLLHDAEYGLLYALGYPRDHLIRYDLERREGQDLGRIGSINAQVLFLDARHRVWTSDDYGHLVRYDPACGRIERSPHVVPHNEAYQTGWHSVLYDAARAPDGEWIYAVTWNGSPTLLRVAPDEGAWGRVESLGPVTPESDRTLPEDYFIDHCGGLVFAGDGCLYYVASRWQGDYRAFPGETAGLEGAVWRLDTETLEREAVAVLAKPSGPAQYVSRGAVDAAGDLFFGNVGYRPVGVFKVTLPPECKRANAHLPLRMWG